MLISSLLFISCYSIEQGVEQINLFIKQEPIDKIITENKENADRIEKLKIVKSVLEFGQNEVGLNPGKSYQKYVSLNSSYVSWIVQAAEKRSLKLKTWWFPFIGEQPYLGFFNKESALNERDNLINSEYDTVMGGVSAFSLLGYYPDPLYSSMLDQYTMPQFIETLLHESLHRTLYIKNYYSFNENLADFIAKKATTIYLNNHPELGQDSNKYLNEYNNNLIAQKKFQEFLIKIKNDLNKFYTDIKIDSKFDDDQIFLRERENKFNQIALEYKKFMNGVEIGTNYENVFQFGKINNAVILSYSIYESKQEPFEIALKYASGSLKKLLRNLEICLSVVPKNEDELWKKVLDCRSVSQ